MDTYDNDRPYEYDTQAEADNPTPAPTPAPAEPSYRPAYVRPAKPRRTVGSIDDDDQDAFDARGNYTHDSNFSASGQRRVRPGSDRLRRDSQYGQYLQVPKGKKSIFSSQQQAQQRRSAIVLVVIVVVLIVLLVFAVQLITSAK